MTGAGLREWGALSAICGGAGVAIYNSVEFLAFSGAPLSQLATRDGWLAFQVVGLFIVIALALGLVAVYLSNADQLGRIGLAGFVIALSGTMQYQGVTWASAFLAPSVGRGAPNLLDNPDGSMMAGVLSTVMIFAVGVVVFAIAGIRSGTAPRWAWWLLLIGALVGFGAEFSDLALPVGPVVFGSSFAAIGASMLARMPRRAAAGASAG